jgi:hypothetical protein
VAAIATIVIVGAYDAYRVHVAKPDAIEVASKPAATHENDPAQALPAAPVVAESTPVERENSAAAPSSKTAKVDSPRRATGGQRQSAAPATMRASGHQRPVPARQVPTGRTPPTAHGLASARVDARIAQISEALPPDPSRVLHVSLASCDGDLIARIVCDQSARRRFCEGRWGEAPECAGVANEHGQ